MWAYELSPSKGELNLGFSMMSKSDKSSAVVSHIWHKKRARYPDFLCAALSVTACAAFIKESRMKLVRSTGLDRKSGGVGHPCFPHLRRDNVSYRCLCAAVSDRSHILSNPSPPARQPLAPTAVTKRLLSVACGAHRSLVGTNGCAPRGGPMHG
jgi:hypothetical protein